MQSYSDEELKKAAAGIAEITFTLLMSCQEKEERFAKRIGLTRSEFRCLRFFGNEKKINIKTLVERMNVSGSRLTRVLDDLERKGFIKRSFDLKDRRSITIVLTKNGEKLITKMDDSYIQIHEEIMADIPKELREPLINGMKRLADSLNSWLKTS